MCVVLHSHGRYQCEHHQFTDDDGAERICGFLLAHYLRAIVSALPRKGIGSALVSEASIGVDSIQCNATTVKSRILSTTQLGFFPRATWALQHTRRIQTQARGPR